MADAARMIAMDYFRRPLRVEDKEDHSPVTVADRSIERFLRSRIIDRFARSHPSRPSGGRMFILKFLSRRLLQGAIIVFLVSALIVTLLRAMPCWGPPM